MPSLVGNVREPNGTPVAGASVVYRDTYSDLEAETDAGGRYRIDGLDSHRDPVTAAAPGFPPVVRKVSVPETGEAVLDFVLRRADTDAEGRFRFEGVPEGLCRVSALHPFRQWVRPGEVTAVVIPFEPGPTLEGTVLAA